MTGKRNSSNAHRSRTSRTQLHGNVSGAKANHPANEGTPCSGPLVFISHSHHDEKLAEALVDYLVERSISPNKIRCSSHPAHQTWPGDIPAELRKDMRASQVVFAIISKSSLKSGWVLGEIGAAWVLEKKIIPILAPGLPSSVLNGPGRNDLSIRHDEPQASTKMQRMLDDLLPISAARTTPAAAARRTVKLDAFIDKLKLSDDAPRVGDDFCAMNVSFLERKRPIQTDEHEPLILFHTYLNVGENMELEPAQSSVAGFFKNRGDQIHCPILWSLLGSMEMAVTFRCPSLEIGKEIQQDLAWHIKKSKVKTVDATHLVLNDERVWANGSFEKGRRAPYDPSKYSDRSTHAFIKLDYQDTGKPTDHDKAIRRIEKLLKDDGGDINVDLYAFSECKQFAIIELQFPCGRQESIKLLSTRLKDELAYWNKDTFIAYEVIGLGSKRKSASI